MKAIKPLMFAVVAGIPLAVAPAMAASEGMAAPDTTNMSPNSKSTATTNGSTVMSQSGYNSVPQQPAGKSLAGSGAEGGGGGGASGGGGAGSGSR